MANNARNSRSIRRLLLFILGIGLACFIALFITLIRLVVPLLIQGGNLTPETTAALNRLILLLTVFIIAALYLLYRLIVRVVLAPLDKLTRSIHQITSSKRLELARYDHYGEIKALSGSINDMVEKLSQSTMSTAVFRSIFNGLDAFLFVSDPETYETLFINESMKKHYGLDERAIGQKCWKIFEGPLRGTEGQTGPCAYCPMPELKLEPGTRIVREFQDHLSGKYFESTHRLIEWTDNKKAHLQLCVDITSLKAAETESLAAKELAEASNLAKTDFLARMSHEMRTPLNAIIGMTAIARQPEKTAYALPKIHEASVHLLSLISDILDMANIETGRLELDNRPFNFRKMIRAVADIMKTRAGEKAQRFTVDIAPEAPETIIADEQRLSQVLSNLLSNAVKFTPPEGNIALKITQTEGSSEYSSWAEAQVEYSALRFEVSDDGPGIAPEQMKHIFALFEQGEGRLNRRYSGVGLGLSICQSIVELMGGEIRVESEQGKGSTFIVEVSVLRDTENTDNESAPAISTEPTDTYTDTTDAFTDTYDTSADTADTYTDTSAPDFSGKTIILAEDVEINREIALALLEDTRLAIDCAENGARALQLFSEDPEKYDGILMDVHMPGVDGLEATRRIRALDLPNAKKIPIIAMTANVFKEDIDKCLAAGMNDHLGKPIDIEKVLEKLRFWLA
jgi:signal transduction histidine kinase